MLPCPRPSRLHTAQAAVVQRANKDSRGVLGARIRVERESEVVGNKSSLKTVPTIVIAHTFCASLDTRISYRQCLLIQRYFCPVWNFPGKVDLSKYSWYLKRKLGVTMHF